MRYSVIIPNAVGDFLMGGPHLPSLLLGDVPLL